MQPPLILIADDDPSIRTLMQAALVNGGFRVNTVESGTQALAAFAAEKPDLLLLDVEMPGASGFDVCEELRRRPENHLVPIVIATGCEDIDSIDRAFEVGATDFISKPINWGLIAHRMRYVLRSAQTSLALQSSQVDNRALLEAFPDKIYVVDHHNQVQRVLGGGGLEATNNNLPRPIDALLPDAVIDELRHATRLGEQTGLATVNC